MRNDVIVVTRRGGP